MQKYILIILLLLLTAVLFLAQAFSEPDQHIEEPFTPFLRQQFRQRSRQFRLGLRDRQRRANDWFNRIIGRYGLGF